MRYRNRRVRKAACVLVEQLERRTLLSETWVGGASGDWDVASNWSGSAVPGASDAVTIPANVSITHTGSAADTAASISSGSGDTLSISGGSIGVSGNASLVNLNLSAGADFNSNGTASISGTFTWTGGALAGSGTTTVLGGGTMSISGGNSAMLDAGTLSNAGTATWAGATFSSTGIFNNSGSFTAQDDQNFSGGTFNNSGTFTKSGTAGTTLFLSGTFNNTGVINVDSGTLRDGDNGSGTGTFNTVTGSTFAFSRGGTYTLNSGSALNGPGLFTLTDSFGTLNVDAAISVANFSLASGYSNGLSGTGVLTVTSNLTWVSGEISGTVDIPSAATVDVNGSGQDLASGGILNNAGMVTYEGTNGLSFGGTFNNSGTFDDQSDATIGQGGTFNNSGTFEKTAGTAEIFGSTFNNNGTVTANVGTLSINLGGTSTGAFDTVAGTSILFTNDDAPYALNAGTTLNGPGMIGVSGSFAVLNIDTNLNVQNFEQDSNYRTMTIATGSTLTITKDFNWVSGSLTGTLDIPVGATMEIAANTQEINSGGVLNNSGVTIYTSSGSADFYVGGTFNNIGTFNDETDAPIQADGQFNNSGTFTKSAGTSQALFVTFNNTGTVNSDSGILAFGIGGSNTGAFNTTAATSIQFTNDDGPYTLGAGATLNGAGLYADVGEFAVLNIDTNITVQNFKQDSSYRALTLSGGNLTVTGTYNWLSGSLQGDSTESVNIPSGAAWNVSNGNETITDLTVNNAGSMTVGGANAVSLQSTALNNSGKLTFFNDQQFGGSTSAVTNSGTILKSAGTGTTTFLSPLTNDGTVEVDSGTISVTGGLTESASGTITTRIFNQGNGTLNVAGAFAMAGKLNILIPANFVPVQGNTYNVVTYGSQTGSFSATTGLTAPSVVLTAAVGASADVVTVDTGGPQPQADLTVGGLTYGAGNYQPGAAISVTGTEVNSGSAATGPYDVTVVLSPDQTYGNGNDIVLATVHETALAPNVLRTLSASGTIPANTPAGNYYVLAQIDSGQVVNETSYANELAVSASADVVILSPPPAPPPPPPSVIGGLDQTFATDGLASHNVGFNSTSGLAVQSDGKSVIVGTTGSTGAEEVGVTRYNADGSLDTTFGTNGVVTTSFGGDDQAAAVALLSNGDILVAGTATSITNGQATGSQFALAEYTSSGALDTTFGAGTGMVLTSFSTTSGTLTDDSAYALAVSPNGTIYVAGSSDAAGKGLDFAIAAYNSDGSALTSFGSGGQVLHDFAGSDDIIRAIALQTNGHIVAAGSTVNPTTQATEVALVRFLSTGALDSRFGKKGEVITAVGSVFDTATSVAIDATGKIIIGGLTATGSAADGSLSSNFLMIRYTSAGAVDRTFGHGPVVTSFNQPAAISKVVIEPDGKIVASGKTTASLSGLVTSALDVAVAQYLPNGALDTTFNGSGTAIFDLSGVESAALAASDLPHADSTPFDALDDMTFTGEVLFNPQDSSAELMLEFQQFELSSQGVVAAIAGGELLDVGNSGVNTVEAAVISSGIDLVAKLIATLPAAVVGGAAGSASVQVSESGSDTESGAITIELYVSPDGTVDSGLSPFQSFTEKVNLRPNQNRVFKLKFDFPSSVADGNYYLVSDIDSGSVRDLDAANNTAASSSTVRIAAPFVDLSGSGLTPVGTFADGKPATASLTVTNNGNVPAKDAIMVQFLASTDGMVSDGITLAEPTVRLNLKAGGTLPLRERLVLPKTLAAGTYYLVAVLDPANVLNDTNLANNVLVSAMQFTIH